MSYIKVRRSHTWVLLYFVSIRRASHLLRPFRFGLILLRPPIQVAAFSANSDVSIAFWVMA